MWGRILALGLAPGEVLVTATSSWADSVVVPWCRGRQEEREPCPMSLGCWTQAWWWGRIWSGRAGRGQGGRAASPLGLPNNGREGSRELGSAGGDRTRFSRLCPAPASARQAPSCWHLPPWSQGFLPWPFPPKAFVSLLWRKMDLRIRFPRWKSNFFPCQLPVFPNDSACSGWSCSQAPEWLQVVSSGCMDGCRKPGALPGMLPAPLGSASANWCSTKL